MEITEEFINRFTGNPSTVSNGRAIAGKGDFALHESEDGKLLFGVCKGSGSSSYNCSIDFSEPDKPIPRCSCPSRQNPCKHAVALLFHKLNGDKFTIESIPEDVTAKREKKAKKQAKLAEEPAPAVMTKAKAAVAAKKCRMQLEGIAMAEKILGNIIRIGLHGMDRENYNLYSTQIKELGNYYISGVQSAFLELLSAASAGQLNQSFAEAMEQINYVYALLKRGKSYLQNKLSDYEAFPETPNAALDLMLHSAIEEQLGYAWKLTELHDNGLFIRNAELLQLSFDSFNDNTLMLSVDNGVWIILDNGIIANKINYRPFSAAKNMSQDDSFFNKIETEGLYIYPGAKNPRVRWDKENIREAGAGDFRKAVSYSRGDFAQVIKEVKAQIINPLADKHPVYLLRASDLFYTDAAGDLKIADAGGNKITLRLKNSGYLLKMASRGQVEGGAITCSFSYDLADDLLYAIPLSLITEQGVIRFIY